MDKGYVQNTIFELLSRLGIGYEKLEHSPIITMKEGSEIAYKLGSTSCKNLFLCNKRQEYFMLGTDIQADTKDKINRRL